MYLTDGVSPFLLELTWLRDHKDAYELGENESQNEVMGLYFIHDPDDYWIEILPAKEGIAL